MMAKLLFRLISIIVLLVFLFLLTLLGYFSFSLYKPSETEQVHIRNPQQQLLIPNQNYTLTTLNIGHGSSSSNNHADSSTPLFTHAITFAQVEANIKAITNQLAALNSDFYTLQDVDQKAKRSHFINQNERISAKFNTHSAAFTYIFSSDYIPLPLDQPVGQLESGLLTLSKYATSAVQRIALPIIEGGIAKTLMQQQYAILETKIPVRGDRELVIANLQLAHFNPAERLSERQLAFIEAYIQSYLEDDAYLILSGDWSQLLTSPTFKLVEDWPLQLAKLPASFYPKGMSWAIDRDKPTTRSMVAPYQQGITFVYISDGFLVSNNVEIVSTKTTDMQFMYSSHQPVTLTFRLK